MNPPQWRSAVPFYQHLGLQLVELEDGKSMIRLPFQQPFANTRGEMHGGAVSALVDAAMSQAVRSVSEAGVRVATITLNLNYLAPAHGDLLGAGTVVKRGRSVCFVEAVITDARGEAVCRAAGTYRVAAPKSEQNGDRK